MTTKREIEDRLIKTEGALLTCAPTRLIENSLAAEFGVTTRTVRSYIRRIKDEWSSNATTVDREGRRREMREVVRGILHRALSRRQQVRDAAGNLVFDENGEPRTVPAPQLGQALRAADLLAKLDGLAAPAEVRVDLAEERMQVVSGILKRRKAKAKEAARREEKGKQAQ